MNTSEPTGKSGDPVGPVPVGVGEGVAAGNGGGVDLEVEVSRLVRMASDYASQALQSLVEQSSQETDRMRDLFYNYVDLACRLEVHFLFPNLADSERLLLVGLASARRAIQVGQRNTEHYRDPVQLKRHGEALDAVRQKFLSTRAEVVSRGVVRMLTRVQAAILEREFMRLPPREEAGGAGQGEEATTPAAAEGSASARGC